MQCDARTANLLDDLLCGGCPYERFWILIMRLDEFFDGPFQIGNALEDAAAQTFPSELAEEAFDDIEPRATGRREMDMKAGVSFQLILHVLVFVRGIVVHDQIDVQVGRRFLVNQPRISHMKKGTLGSSSSFNPINKGCSVVRLQNTGESNG